MLVKTKVCHIKRLIFGRKSSAATPPLTKFLKITLSALSCCKQARVDSAPMARRARVKQRRARVLALVITQRGKFTVITRLFCGKDNFGYLSFLDDISFNVYFHYTG